MRVVIAEDEALMRAGLRALLEDFGMEVVAQAGDADELHVAVDTHLPDLVVTDIRMPPGHQDDGLVAAIAIRRRHPHVAVLVLSQHVQRRSASSLLANGASGVGYLLKQRVADVEQFRSDLETIAAGGTVIDREVVEGMLSRPSRQGVERLTARQREVLALVAQGRSNAAIAARLVVSERAVVQHVSNIYDVLGIPEDADDHRRVLAALQFLGA